MIIRDNAVIVTVFHISGEPMLDSQSVEGQSLIPREWIKRGRRRASEAKAHSGSDAMLDSLRYWARKDQAAELKAVYR